MEVPSAVLEKLVCKRCSGYLARGPVYLVEKTKYRCGRCPCTADEGEEEGIRAEAYEALAKLMTFPCRYKEYGCTSKVLFLENKQHEEACPYRQYRCPVTESGQCDWTGPQTGILKHCQQDHPTKVLLENPCTFTYDSSWPSLNNFVLFEFDVLFLIQSKVYAASQKMYHAVLLIDDSARASDFKFTLDIETKLGKLTKFGNVESREVLVLQEETSVVTGINCLQEMLGDFKDTTFTVTVEFSGQGTSRSTTLDQITAPVQTLEVTVRCRDCDATTELVYRGSWLCKRHAAMERTCKNKTRGCTYSDVDEKCRKHELYNCQYITKCYKCSEDITGTTLDAHYTQAHGIVIHRAGTVCTVSRPENAVNRLIIDSDLGRTVCRYWLRDSDFALQVFTSIPSAQLYKYRCTVDLSHPDTGHTLTRTPTIQYVSRDDWIMRIPLSDLNTCVHDEKVNIKINITKIDDPSQFMV